MCAWVRASQKTNLSQLFVAGSSMGKVPVTPNPAALSRHILDANKWYNVGWRLESAGGSYSSTFFIADEQASVGDSILIDAACQRLGFSPSVADGLIIDVDEISVFSGSAVSSCSSGGVRRYAVGPTAPTNVLGVYQFDGNVSSPGLENDQSGAETASQQFGNFTSVTSDQPKGFNVTFSSAPWVPAIIRSANPSSSPPQGGDRITLSGLNFADSSFAFCMFDTVAVSPVSGSFVDDSVVCVSPPLSPGIIRLTFSNNCTQSAFNKKKCPTSDTYAFFLVGDNSLTLSSDSNFTIPMFSLPSSAVSFA
jgi:hypothetical protein